MKTLQDRINKLFKENFGKTSLKERLEKIRGEAVELSRYHDIKHIKEEAGDLLCSLIQLLNESDWTIEEVVNETLDKIEKKNIYNKLGRKNNIAIIGLAGNPPTQGHVSMGEFLLKEGYCDEVWYMPCYDHVAGKDLVSSIHRLKMLDLAIGHNPHLKISDLEIKYKLTGKTYYTVKKLENPDLMDNYNFKFVIGQDNANSFHKWYKFNYLKDMVIFIVMNREGYTPEGSWYLKEPHIFIKKKFQTREISSTFVKELLIKSRSNEEEKTLKEIVNPKVLDYIIKNKLYPYKEANK